MKTLQQLPGQVIFSYLAMGVSFLINPILILVLTRGLTLSEYGAYALLAVTVNVAAVILELGFSQYIIARLTGTSNKQKSITSILFFFLILLIALLVLVQISPLQNVILGFLKLASHRTEFQIATFIITTSTLSRVILAYISAQKRIILVNTLTILTSLLQLIFLLAAIKITTLNLFIVMLTWLISAIVTLITCVVLIIRDIKLPTIENAFKTIREGIIFSIPLLAVVSSSWIIEIGDRYLINLYMGKEEVALYTLAYSLMTVAASLGTIISQTFFPHYADAWNRKKPTSIFLNASIKYTLLIVLPATTGLVALGREIITLISGPTYLAAYSIMPVLLVYPILSALSYILYQILLLSKQTRKIALIYLLGAIANILLNIILIPVLGIVGAAIATITSYLIIFFVLVKNATVDVDYGFIRIGRILLANIILGTILWNISPTNALTKILTIAFGAIIYGVLVLALKVFNSTEISLIAHALPRNFFKNTLKTTNK